MDCHELDWIRLDSLRCGLDGIGSDEMGLDWIGLDWIGLDWVGRDWIGLDWIALALALAVCSRKVSPDCARPCAPPSTLQMDSPWAPRLLKAGGVPDTDRIPVPGRRCTGSLRGHRGVIQQLNTGARRTPSHAARDRTIPGTTEGPTPPSAFYRGKQRPPARPSPTLTG